MMDQSRFSKFSWTCLILQLLCRYTSDRFNFFKFNPIKWNSLLLKEIPLLYIYNIISSSSLLSICGLDTDTRIRAHIYSKRDILRGGLVQLRILFYFFGNLELVFQPVWCRVTRANARLRQFFSYFCINKSFTLILSTYRGTGPRRSGCVLCSSSNRISPFNDF